MVHPFVRCDLQLIMWIVLAILISYLCVSIFLRIRAEAAARLSDHTPCCQPFDPAPISPRIQQLRENHAAVAHSRFRPSSSRKTRLVATRRLIAHLEYFHHDRSREETPCSKRWAR